MSLLHTWAIAYNNYFKSIMQYISIYVNETVWVPQAAMYVSVHNLNWKLSRAVAYLHYKMFFNKKNFFFQYTVNRRIQVWMATFTMTFKMTITITEATTTTWTKNRNKATYQTYRYLSLQPGRTSSEIWVKQWFYHVQLLAEVSKLYMFVHANRYLLLLIEINSFKLCCKRALKYRNSVATSDGKRKTMLLLQGVVPRRSKI